jgi:class 3 adenylate cyclase
VAICPACGHANPEGAKYCMECAAPLGASAPPREVRKLVTVLFCDLVGSTSLGETNDPEVLRPILDGCFTEMRGAVEHHGGGVQKFIGAARRGRRSRGR